MLVRLLYASRAAQPVTPDAIEKWKAEHGYDKPLLWNSKASGTAKFSDTIFFNKSGPVRNAAVQRALGVR